MGIRRLARTAVPVVLTAMLVACASEQAKQAPVATAAAAPKSTQGPGTQSVAPKPVAANPLTDPNSMLAKRSVFYDYDSYAVRPEFRPLVEAHAGYVKQHPGSSVIVEGNGDERGSREYNLALGQRRADSVKKLMVLLGDSERQIETVSFGEEKPRAAGHDEAAWAQNRRSDIVYKKEQ
jgi:peptidoglycan-associated lipoprotein